MAKRPSLFAAKTQELPVENEPTKIATVPADRQNPSSRRPPSREGKRAFTIYVDPLAWKQIRQLALDTDSTAQALGEEAVNLLFAKHGLNRSA